MKTSPMNRERWTELFQAIGLDEATMRRWHAEFEQRYPEGHQAFLEWLNIDTASIQTLRDRLQAA